MDLCIAYFMCLIFFYRANSWTTTTTTSHSVITYIAPLILILGFSTYCVLSLIEPSQYNAFHMSIVKQSTGIFKSSILVRAISAPFYPIRFQDVFLCDALTSFTRIISDSLYAVCWLVSGTFLRSPTEHHDLTYSHFGSSRISCTNNKMSLTVSMFVLVPLWIRFAQCCRAFVDNSSWEKKSFPWFPHGMNALKYALSALVVIYSVFLQRVDTFFLFLISFTTLYKWLWDIVVDWGMLDAIRYHGVLSLPGQPMFLRTHLMYRDTRFYYFAIIADLLLRAIWVVSLAPASLTQGFAKSAFQLLMGSLEIFRRAMWSILRIENEHISKLYGHALGVVLEKSKIDVEAAKNIICSVRDLSTPNLSSLSQDLPPGPQFTSSQDLPPRPQFTSSSAVAGCDAIRSSNATDIEDVRINMIRKQSLLDSSPDSIPSTPRTLIEDTAAEGEIQPIQTTSLYHSLASEDIVPGEDEEFYSRSLPVVVVRNRSVLGSISSVGSDRTCESRVSRSYSLATNPALKPLEVNSNLGLATRSRHQSYDISQDSSIRGGGGGGGGGGGIGGIGRGGGRMVRSSSREWPNNNNLRFDADFGQAAITPVQARTEKAYANTVLQYPFPRNSTNYLNRSLSGDSHTQEENIAWHASV